MKLQFLIFFNTIKSNKIILFLLPILIIGINILFFASPLLEESVAYSYYASVALLPIEYINEPILYLMYLFQSLAILFYSYLYLSYELKNINNFILRYEERKFISDKIKIIIIVTILVKLFMNIALYCLYNEYFLLKLSDIVYPLLFITTLELILFTLVLFLPKLSDLFKVFLCLFITLLIMNLNCYVILLDCLLIILIVKKFKLKKYILIAM